MNAVEIEEAVSLLVEQPFNKEEFPFEFLQAFGNKEVAIKRLRTGGTNKSDVPGAVLQQQNIHLLACAEGKVSSCLQDLRQSPKTKTAKARFILATDGKWLEAENLVTGEPLATAYAELPNHFGFFLELAGISTVKEIKDNPIDIRATSKLNRLYLELKKENPDWDTHEKAEAMDHFLARLIFCFYAEDTHIFQGESLFTKTVEQMTAGKEGAAVESVLPTIFRAMCLDSKEREQEKLPSWALAFPHVNGGLFSGSTEVPRFTEMARSYLLHAGSLDWRQINPDIFGSMIQAVASKDDRGELGMHYTSVPNILKVLNPLFLDELSAELEKAGTNRRKLQDLRKRLARIRVFDPACGSGNFLVIAYKELRKLEHEINQRLAEPDKESAIPISNFRGIELRSFPAEIARLALVIAKFQTDKCYLGERKALQTILPLEKDNWITCGNALRLDWLSLVPPTGTGVKLNASDLFSTPLDQTEIDFENEGGETYICGNPPYKGSSTQSEAQKSDLKDLLSKHIKKWRSLDYIAGWFFKASQYSIQTHTSTAFVSTNSICQGEQVPALWTILYRYGLDIFFAHTSFKWKNLAAQNAGVTVIVVGFSNLRRETKALFVSDDDGTTSKIEMPSISPYLVPGKKLIVELSRQPIGQQALMEKGNMPTDGGNLILDFQQKQELSRLSDIIALRHVKNYMGSNEIINGLNRYCIWVTDEETEVANKSPFLRKRFLAVRDMRRKSEALTTRPYAEFPHRFRQIQGTAQHRTIVVPRVSSESRDYLPVGYLDASTIISDSAFAIYDASLWNLALVASKLHLLWIATVCGKLETRLRYSNTLGWNTFPVPTLTAQNKADLTRCAEEILLAREAHWPATIAELYKPGQMPENLRQAHERNDEVLERIYIGRRFRNDTERLEKLFELYSQMAKTNNKA